MSLFFGVGGGRVASQSFCTLVVFFCKISFINVLTYDEARLCVIWVGMYAVCVCVCVCVCVDVTDVLRQTPKATASRVSC